MSKRGKGLTESLAEEDGAEEFKDRKRKDLKRSAGGKRDENNLEGNLSSPLKDFFYFRFGGKRGK